MGDAALQQETVLAGRVLGGPGAPDPAQCSQAAIDVLGRVAGPGMRLTQIQLDLSSRPIGQGDVVVTSRVDKRTRSILFASVEARAAGELVFRAHALFSRAA